MKISWKYLGIIASALIVAGCGGSAPTPTTPVAPPPPANNITGTPAQFYNKTVVGSTWTYLNTKTVKSPGKPALTTTEEVVSTITHSTGGTVIVSSTHTLNGSVSVPVISTIQIDINGALIETTSLETFLLLPSKFTVGTTWIVISGSSKAGTGDLKAKIVDFDAIRATPIGNFVGCLQIDYTLSYVSASGTVTGTLSKYVSSVAGATVDASGFISFPDGSTVTTTSKLQSYNIPFVDTRAPGVIFSATLGSGINSVSDTHYDPVSGTYVAGGKTIAGANAFLWNDPNGGVVSVAYADSTKFLAVVLGSPVNITGCGINRPTVDGYPACSSIGITFDRIHGVISFVSTPVSLLYGSRVTATGALTFKPF